MTGGECLLRTLVNHGITTCFMNPGTSEMQFVTALDRVPEMRGVLCLQEVVVSGAADGYARMAGKPAATLLHLGPGMGNALSNFHNARKARSPIVNVIGEHATFHLPYDAPLTADVAAFAHPVSKWLRTAPSADSIGPLTSEAYAAAMRAPSGIASLIVPADWSWSESAPVGEPVSEPPAQEPDEQRIEAALEYLRHGEKCALIVNGRAASEPGASVVAQIAAATGARVFANRFAARMTSGRGAFRPTRIPYFPEMAEAALAGLTHAILLDMSEPVSFFGYPGRRSTLLPAGCAITTLAAAHEDVPGALSKVAARCGPPRTTHADPPAAVLPMDGPLTPETIGAVIAALIPEGAVVVDEMVSSGFPVHEALRGAPAHEVLPVTGGSIGQGLPLAVGVAVAVAGQRKVLALEGDGSGMYSPQALWTMARERLDIVVVIFVNRRYRILGVEVDRTNSGGAGPKADAMLDLRDPDLDWVLIAKGQGVDGVRVDTTNALAVAFRDAVRRTGPYLIEAIMS